MTFVAEFFSCGVIECGAFVFYHLLYHFGTHLKISHSVILGIVEIYALYLIKWIS